MCLMSFMFKVTERPKTHFFSTVHLPACSMQVIVPGKNITTERFYEKNTTWKFPSLKHSSAEILEATEVMLAS